MNKFICLIVTVLLLLTSCSTTEKVLSRAVNTINTAPLDALNLERKDYEILNTVTADATIIYKQKFKHYMITNKEDEFCILYEDGRYRFSGILRLGFLANDYVLKNLSDIHPEEMARRLAIYRAINLAQQYGADAMIEPIISTNIEQVDKNIIFKSTVTAKLIKLKTNN